MTVIVFDSLPQKYYCYRSVSNVLHLMKYLFYSHFLFTAVKRFHIQRWHKITFSAICIIIIGGIFAILSIILSHNNHEDSSSSNGSGDDSSPKPSKYCISFFCLSNNKKVVKFLLAMLDTLAM